MRRNAALLAECEDTTTSDAEAAREKHQEKLIKVEDALIKVLPRSDATTGRLSGRWANIVHDKLTTRGYNHHLNRNEDCFSAASAMMHFNVMMVYEAPQGYVSTILRAFYQVLLNTNGTEPNVWMHHRWSALGP